MNPRAALTGLVLLGALAACSGSDEPPPEPETSATAEPSESPTPDPTPVNDFTLTELEKLSAFCIDTDAVSPPSAKAYIAYTQAPQELIDEIRRLADDLYSGTGFKSEETGEPITPGQACSTISKDMAPYIQEIIE